MSAEQKRHGMIKFIFWAALSILLVAYAWHSYSSGQMITWYYWESNVDGFAINDKTFRHATKEKPLTLAVGNFEKIDGLQAVPVKKGQRLPANTNGVISKKDVEEAKRVKLDGDKLTVSVPIQVKEARGFKYKDGFKHKGIHTNPWSGVWNVAFVLGLGICLGYMAEGATDVFGLKLKKIEHYGH